MPHRRTGSDKVFDELFTTFKSVPWWAGPIFIGLIYALLAWILPAAFGATAGDDTFGKTFGAGVATICEQFAPWAAGLAAVVWLAALIARVFDVRQLDRQAGIETIRELSWQQLERLLAEAFRRQGYVVTETPPSNDGGVDLILDRRGERVLVQCKQWKVWKVGVKTVRELAGVVATQKATCGIVVTSGEYTRDARTFSEQSGIRLIDGSELVQLIRSVQTGGETEAPVEPVRREAPPACPSCGTEMVKRVAKRGAHAGESFWGCKRYPGCKGTRPVLD